MFLAVSVLIATAELYQRARFVEKTLQVVKGVSHYDLYDRPVTAQALSEIIPFFKHLGTYGITLFTRISSYYPAVQAMAGC